MVRGFTFLDPVFFGGSREVLVPAYVNLGPFAENGHLDISFFGSHQGAQEYVAGVGQDLSFLNGASSLVMVFLDNGSEAVSHDTSFHQGTHFFALLSYGMAGTDRGVSDASFLSGQHDLTLLIVGSGSYAAIYDAGAGSNSFLSGLHAEIRIPQTGSLASEAAIYTTAFGTGTYFLSGSGDGKNGGYVVRLVLTNGSPTATILYADSGILAGHTFELDGVVYTITVSEGTTLTINPAFAWDTGTYQVLTVPPGPVPPPPPPPPETIAYGTILHDFSTQVESASFLSGTHFEALIFGGSELDLAPAFATFLSGRHAFTLENADGDAACSTLATFSSGSHTHIVVVAATVTDNGHSSATFQTGFHSTSPGVYATADITVTADTSAPSLDSGVITLDSTTTLDGAATADRGVAHFDDAQSSPSLDEDLYRWSEEG